MNKHISTEINAQFIAAGCTNMAVESTDVDYYHCSTGLYLLYSPELSNRQLHSIINSTEVVMVVDNDDEVKLAIDCELPIEVIKLEDLAEFLVYREFSQESWKYRSAKQCYDGLNEAFSQVEDAHEQAKCNHERAAKKFSTATAKLIKVREAYERAHDAHKDATAAFWSHPKPPRFSRVAAA